jgi:LDH2 family malate/lactate/ureidoglycolate dehydrogenase
MWTEIGQAVNADADRKGAVKMISSTRFRTTDLVQFAETLLYYSGLARERARAVAEILVEGDLLGHTTHGLQLLPIYLGVLERGEMAHEGEPTVLSDHGSAISWDANWLPGPWMMRRCLDVAFGRMERQPTVTTVVRRASHIGCLAAYAYDAAQRGYFLLLTCSDPSVASVAPYGAVEGRMTPNPIAAGWPTQDVPVFIDVCPSTTTNGMIARLARNGERLPGPWLITGAGDPTDDPVTFGPPEGSAIMPLGGIDLGHKGFALGLLVETLTSALGGFGRADETNHWGASVFALLINPAMFGGADAFRREAQWLADSCRSAKPRPEAKVRLPGERAHAIRLRGLADGVVLHAETMPNLEPWALRLGVVAPPPLES